MVQVRTRAGDAAAGAAVVDGAIAAGLTAIRTEADVPGEFPPDVLAAAEAAAARRPGPQHTDRTAVGYLTLDPASATDLDQAFAIETAGTDIVLHYAIADVGFFVDPGGPLDAAAWERGEPCTCPTARFRCIPDLSPRPGPACCPMGRCPAVVFTACVDETGEARLDGVERAIIHSRAKLAYEDVDEGALPAGFAELSRRIVAAEDRRGAPRVEFPEQVLELTDEGWRLRFDTRLESEDHNAGMSLATNLAVADALHAARTGLFRVMPDASPWAIRRLHLTARAFGLDWPDGMSLRRFQRSLPSGDQRSGGIPPRRAPGQRRRRRTGPTPTATSPGTRRWPPRTATPPPHCAGSPIGTSSRRRWPWAPARRFPTTSRPLSPSCRR